MPRTLFRLLVLLALLIPARAAAQAPGPVPIDTLDSAALDAEPPDSTVGPWTFHLALGAQARLGSPFTGRLVLEVRSSMFGVAPVTFASLPARSRESSFLSVNPILLVPGYLGYFIHPVVGAILLLPQLLPNLSFELPILKNKLSAVVAQRTDYFYDEEVFRIHTEAQLGLRLRVSHVAVDLLYVQPLTHSVMESKGYVGAGFSVELMR